MAALENKVMEGFEKIEDTVTKGYQKIENATVDGFQNVSEYFVKRLFSKEGETVAEMRQRLAKQKHRT